MLTLHMLLCGLLLALCGIINCDAFGVLNPLNLKRSTALTTNCPSSRLPPDRRQVMKASLGGKALIVIGAAVTICNPVRIIQQSDIAIVERLGKFQRILKPGLNFIVPFIDNIRAKVTDREQVLDIPPQKCITTDNAPLLADAVVYWRIFNPELAIYSVVDLELAIQNLVLTQLRSEIGKLTLDDTFSAREQINSILLDDLDVATDPWGVKITRVEVRDIIPDTEILKAMEMQMAAERTKRAAVIKSEGERERAINEAEGEARSRIIDAEATAEAIKIKATADAAKIEIEAAGAAKALAAVAERMPGGSVDYAARYQLMCDYITAQRDIATSNNSKIIVSSSNSDEFFAKAVGFYDGDSFKEKVE